MEINFEYCLIELILFIDISSHLRNLVPLFCYELLSFDAASTSIIIHNYSYNDNNNCTIFDISRFTLIESIEIGDDCFESVKTFQIDGLNRLKSIKIGEKSFTRKKNGEGNDESKSFHILNCESLESIQIGKCSFSDFGGEFELKNLPQLQSIHFGYIHNYDSFSFCRDPRDFSSYNFRSSSFIIRGIDMILIYE